jgi:hypothetical protein
VIICTAWFLKDRLTFVATMVFAVLLRELTRVALSTHRHRHNVCCRRKARGDVDYNILAVPFPGLVGYLTG